jgi:sterol desaturase/sphingolipid hydroxylase (fatty acid hydroxylase superfamily)
MLGAIVAVFVGCLVVERAVPGWRPLRVLAVNAAQLGVVLLAGATWEKWLAGNALFDLPDVPAAAGGVAAYFVATFVFYWWHRWRHEVDWLWLHFHQIHHSAQRLEVITSFYKHPVEMIANSIIGSVLVYAVLGLSLEGGAVYTLCCALGEFFYHTNCQTPSWIGYLFQRPEMHRIHHEHGAHRYNYGDIVWWDMLFGTWRNPVTWEGRCGFDPAREERLVEMLRFRDVHRAPAQREASR